MLPLGHISDPSIDALSPCGFLLLLNSDARIASSSSFSGFFGTLPCRTCLADRRVLTGCATFRLFDTGRRFRGLRAPTALLPVTNNATAIRVTTARAVASGALPHTRVVQPKVRRRTAVVSSSNPATKASTANTKTVTLLADRPKRSHPEVTRRDRLRPPTPRVRRATFVVYFRPPDGGSAATSIRRRITRCGRGSARGPP